MVVLAYDSPSRQMSSRERQFVHAVDFLAVFMFTAEAITRIVAQGFMAGRTSYLRSGWNVC